MRRATLADWARLFYWRNDEATTAASVKTEPVTLETHLAWLRVTLASEVVRLYIHEDAPRNRCVGTGRLDLRRGPDPSAPDRPRHKSAKPAAEVETAVELSLTLDPRYRDGGYAVQIIEALLQEAQAWRPSLPVVARVRVLPVPNYASLRAFSRLGFLPAVYAGEFVELTRA